MPMKLALVVRTDLGMGRGKIAAQVAHAAVAAVLRDPAGPALTAWLREGQPKVVLRVGSETELRTVSAAARAAGIATVLISDAGRTQVAPGTVTCCAVGPGPTDRVDAVTGDLALL
jgi:PTH2 family peptidyl-tRNA hydrolase